MHEVRYIELELLGAGNLVLREARFLLLAAGGFYHQGLRWVVDTVIVFAADGGVLVVGALEREGVPRVAEPEIDVSVFGEDLGDHLEVLAILILHLKDAKHVSREQAVFTGETDLIEKLVGDHCVSLADQNLAQPVDLLAQRECKSKTRRNKMITKRKLPVRDFC